MTIGDEEKIVVIADPDLEDLIPGFLENRRQDLARLAAALQRGEYETIRNLGHAMKGFGKSYGFADITEIGSRIERAALEKAAVRIAQAVDELAGYLGRVHVVYHGDETTDQA